MTNSWSCAGRIANPTGATRTAPAVDLGDDRAYMNEAIAAIKTHEGALTLGKR